MAINISFRFGGQTIPTILYLTSVLVYNLLNYWMLAEIFLIISKVTYILQPQRNKQKNLRFQLKLFWVYISRKTTTIIEWWKYVMSRFFYWHEKNTFSPYLLLSDGHKLQEKFFSSMASLFSPFQYPIVFPVHKKSFIGRYCHFITDEM